MKQEKNQGGTALLPLVVFILLFVGTGIITGDFTSMPIPVAVIIASIVAFFIHFKEPFEEKFKAYLSGASQNNIILMVIIFILAGAFSEVAGAMGAVESTVNLGLTLLPVHLLLSGLFIICCFVSFAMGTSTGTVVAIVPIAIELANQTDIALPLAVATVIGGAMFGDNLSFISDTTIVATRSQEVRMIDKFRVNVLIILPSAVITTVILYFMTMNASITSTGQFDYQLIEILPYFAVIVIALFGVDVIIVLISGIIIAGVLGFSTGAFDGIGFITAAGDGIESMQTISIIAILIGGMIGLIRHYGGIDYMLNLIRSKIRTKKGAEFGIAGLVSVTDIGTANNTISIIMTGPLAKDIADEYGVDRRKSASILDIFAAGFQGIIPYGGQMLAAAGFASTISPIEVMPYSIYPALLLIAGAIAIWAGFPRKYS
ncbi:Na+/H+ antiporter NhaC family protein [Corticicoccus populi]|uniref:Na+/H+ antiporter NhaC family protein n=1 Tax=Corticicoccus populi TaxID=1812821 RepID=A0ABW5WSG4_9STAP